MTRLPEPSDYTSDGRKIRHYAEYHRPRFYRYRVADPGLRVVPNRYANQHSAATIGIALVVGRYAYCIKWAHSRIATTKQTAGGAR